METLVGGEADDKRDLRRQSGTMNLFGDLQVRLDPWQVDYGAELPLDSEQEAAADENIILDIEVPPEQWQPITPVAVRIHERLVFVDGVRRVEARLIVRRADRICHGAFGSYAVGAVAVADAVAPAASHRLVT